MKLSVKEAKLTGFGTRNCATIQQVWISKFAFGSEGFWAFRETGPWSLRNDVIVTQCAREQTKDFLQIHLEFAYYSFRSYSFGIENDKQVHTLPKFPRKQYPIADQQNEQIMHT